MQDSITTTVEDEQRTTFQDLARKVSRNAALDPQSGLPAETVDIFGLALAVVNAEETLVAIANKIHSGEPGYFITANLHYARLTAEHDDLPSLNAGADFVVADGMPLVWYSRWTGTPLPERVTGSDMIYRIASQAAELGHRIFFLGGAPGVALDAANRLHELNPNLKIAGVETPPFRPLTEDENSQLIERIRTAGTDILFVALGQPKGERWLADNLQQLGVPVCVQLGASFDFVAGRVKRAPKFYQRTGLEWAYRLCTEPRRMLPRYTGDAWFLAKSISVDIWSRIFGRRVATKPAKKTAHTASSPPKTPVGGARG
ncbi:MAG: WecB/TagA/CpsF family glycosyltransferase [Pirellulales bacterium]|nr:WecB/TagA/CpsF family glycosyltransferase [Pirellulales bacterium]